MKNLEKQVRRQEKLDTEYKYDDKESSPDQLLPVDVDLEEIQRVHRYEKQLPQEVENSFPLVDFETDSDVSNNREVDNEDLIAQNDHGPILMPPPDWVPTSTDFNDNSEALPHRRITDEEPHPFILAFGLWCQETGIS
jgi:hypothetical protein